MASLTLTYGDMYNQVAEFLRIGSTPVGTNLTLVKNIVKRAYRKFLYPVNAESGLLHTWSFLRRTDTVQTLAGTYRYELPLDFVSILTSPKLVNGENKRNPEYIDIAKFNGLRTTSVGSGIPYYYCIDIGSYHKEFGQLHELKFWKSPNDSYAYEYGYIFEPSAPENADDVLVGGARASEVIMQMALSIAELQEDESSSIQTTAADKLLVGYMAWDKAYGMNTFGEGWDDARKINRPVEGKTNES